MGDRGAKGGCKQAVCERVLQNFLTIPATYNRARRHVAATGRLSRKGYDVLLPIKERAQIRFSAGWRSCEGHISHPGIHASLALKRRHLSRGHQDLLILSKWLGCIVG